LVSWGESEGGRLSAIEDDGVDCVWRFGRKRRSGADVETFERGCREDA